TMRETVIQSLIISVKLTIAPIAISDNFHEIRIVAMAALMILFPFIPVAQH
ncbi:unnamed protein product, partial [marine sediment metagenome]